jgi:RiboL-PSP-HEPN
MSCADDFLASTNPIFDECLRGVTTLSNIVVSVKDSLVGEARAALVPALYAYWERFFRLTFGEFLRCVSVAGISAAALSDPLVRFRIRREFLRLDTSHRTILLESLDRRGPSQAQALLHAIATDLQSIESLFNQPVAFPDPDSWIETDSNVRYEVLEKICSRLGVDPEDLKSLLGKYVLYPALKELVDMRNDIAHGTVIAPLDAAKWNALQEFVSVLMNAVQLFLYEALANDRHLVLPASAPP